MQTQTVKYTKSCLFLAVAAMVLAGCGNHSQNAAGGTSDAAKQQAVVQQAKQNMAAQAAYPQGHPTTGAQNPASNPFGRK